MISVYYVLIDGMFLSLHQKTALGLADEGRHTNVYDFLSGAVSVDTKHL